MSVRISIASVLAISTVGETLTFAPSSIAAMANGETVDALLNGASVRVAALDGETLSILPGATVPGRPVSPYDTDDSLDFDDETDEIGLDTARASVSNGPNGPMLTVTGDGFEESADISYADAAEFEAGSEIVQTRFGDSYGVSADGVRLL